MTKADKPAWIQADVRARVDGMGIVEATLSGLRAGQGERPNSHKEAGADAVAFEAIHLRQPGVYETPAYVGGANVLLAPFDAFELISDTEERALVLKRFRNTYGAWDDEQVMLCCVRNDRAPAIHNTAEPAGGMAVTFDLLLDQLKEASEIGIYKHGKRWYRFLPDDLSDDQVLALQQEQKECWEIILPGSSTASSVINLQSCLIGQDTLDDRQGLITAGAFGDFAITSFWRLDLELGGAYRFRDLERHFDGKSWHALKRKCVMIANRHDDSPIMFELGPDGLLDRCGMHLALEGAALELNISPLCRTVLGQYGLKWLKQ